jgi:hypothetical protein
MDEKDPQNIIDVDSNFEFVPQNPFTIDGPVTNSSENIAYPGFPVEDEKPGFLRTALEEFKEQSTNVHALHAAQNKGSEENIPSPIARYLLPESYLDTQFSYRPTPDGWTPKSEIERLTNVDPKFIPRLLDSKSPQDFQYRLNDSYEQQEHERILENGSWAAKVFGGLIGLSPLGSIENFIPIASVAAKAKVGSSFFNAMYKSFPGVLGASAIREGAKQMDKQNSNLGDFVLDTFIDTAFGTVLFGSLGAGKSLLNISEFNRLKEFSKNSLKGIGYEYIVSKEGALTGFKAVDTTGGSVGAAEVTKAQEMADAAFYKGGIFKIPYVGAGAVRLLSGNVPGFKYLFGSPLIQLKISKYKSANAFGDAAFDHYITTEGEAKGGTRPESFESKVKRTRADLTNLHWQTTALHAERNGYSIKPRITIGIQNAFNSFRQKALETLSQETDKTNYIGKEEFMDEVQRVLYTGESHENSAVNKLASIYRKIIDDTYRDYRVAHNLPEDWLPPKTAVEYLMRVYDTAYLNTAEGESQFISVVSKWLKDSDETIEQHLKPINDLKKQIKDFQEKHTEAIRELGTKAKNRTASTELSPVSNEVNKPLKTYTAEELKALENKTNQIGQGTSPRPDVFITLSQMKNRLKAMQDQLHDRMREDPSLLIHVDDFNAFSAKESKELTALLKPIKDIEKQIDEQKSVISKLKEEKSKQLSAAKASETKQKAKPKAEKFVSSEEKIKAEEDKLRDLQDNLFLAQDELNLKAHKGEINPRFYNKDENIISFKNPKERLKFRDTYESDFHRETAAKAYYDSIMNLNPEDIVADVFGRVTGKPSENALKRRTLPVPDEILYNNKFMTKDLYAKTANYVNYLSRRTHLKTSFQNVTVNGGFEELAESLLNEYKSNRALISNRISKLKEGEQSPKIKKQIASEEKALNKESLEFENIKKVMKTLYETRMMGINKRSEFDNMARNTLMSITAAANLHNLGATQITDVGFIGFQHGVWPFIRDGVYPFINWLATMGKGADSAALRETAPSLNLGLQDMLNHTADRNFNMDLQPYLNMGKIESGIQKFAHFSSITDLTPYIDNGIQHTAGSVIQSEFMRILHKSVEGTMTEKESLYLRKYGIDPKKWDERMVKAYQESEGFKTAAGGYMSNFWKWQDLEASNEFSKAVFRGVQNTLVWKGMADSPFFADNMLGMFFHNFTGWGYAATNRYLIPSLQHPDGELLLKMLWMYGAGSLVSPTRRMSRGEKPWPDNMTDIQIAYEAFSDSGVFSVIGNTLNIVNYLTNNKLMGDLKNDKFTNRARTGIFGMSDVLSSTASRISDVLGMAAHNEWNERDLKTAAHMLPITGAMYGHWASDKLIESWNLPRNRRAAEVE